VEPNEADESERDHSSRGSRRDREQPRTMRCSHQSGNYNERSHERERERRSNNQSATAMGRETKQKKLSERGRGRKATTRTCPRENTMGHCCALGTLEQCRLPDSVNNPCRQPWGPPLDKSDIGRGGAISLHRLAYIHRSIRVRGPSRRARAQN
jgi:hypothetical protein